MTDRSNANEDAGPEWGTPAWVWKPLSDALGGFDLDPASGAEPEPIAPNRFTVEDDGLSQEWFGDVWLNPPYGRAHNEEWAEYAYKQAYANPGVSSVTCLVANATDTDWFQDYYARADYLTFVRGRVRFHDDGAEDASTTSPSFGSVIATMGDVPGRYVAQLSMLDDPDRPRGPNTVMVREEKFRSEQARVELYKEAWS
jgi:phage N-6-adenine-methyltransferase